MLRDDFCGPVEHRPGAELLSVISGAAVKRVLGLFVVGLVVMGVVHSARAAESTSGQLLGPSFKALEFRVYALNSGVLFDAVQ